MFLDVEGSVQRAAVAFSPELSYSLRDVAKVSYPQHILLISSNYLINKKEHTMCMLRMVRMVLRMLRMFSTVVRMLRMVSFAYGAVYATYFQYGGAYGAA